MKWSTNWRPSFERRSIPRINLPEAWTKRFAKGNDSTPATLPSPRSKPLIYGTLQVVCRLAAITVLQTRAHGRRHVPIDGAALIVSNHQSQLDPLILGLVFNRHLHYLARESLFRHAGFRWLIESLNAIPIDLDGNGMAGLKETLRRLKRGEMVHIFPEGTRSPDGEIHRFQPGFVAVARRAGVPIVPVAILGAYDSLPREARVPRPATVQVEIGEPFTPQQIREMTERELVQAVECRVRELFERAWLRREYRAGSYYLDRA